jgi:hypothetical protein
MAGTKTKQSSTGKNTASVSRKQSKSLAKARSSTSAKTPRKTTRNDGSARLDSPGTKSSSSSSTKKRNKTGLKTQNADSSGKSSTPKSLKEVISGILAAQTPEQRLRHLSNLKKGRAMVAGEFRRPGRPKKEPEQKEKNRALRASDEFVAQARELAEHDGFKGQWQTWLKSLAKKRFEEVKKSS